MAPLKAILGQTTMKEECNPSDALIPTKVRLKAYLEWLGILDQEVMERAVQTILRLSEKKRGREDCERVAMAELIQRKEEWFLFLNEFVARGAGSSSDPMVGWRLQALLRKEPTFFLERPNVDSFEGNLGLWDSRALPEMQKREMVIQPLGKLPNSLKKEFWRSCHTKWQRRLKKFFRRFG